jgi:hypothetical protein
MGVLRVGYNLMHVTTVVVEAFLVASVEQMLSFDHLP